MCEVQDALVELELMLALVLREDSAALLHKHLTPVVFLDPQVVCILLKACLVGCQFDWVWHFGRLFSLHGAQS